MNDLKKYEKAIENLATHKENFDFPNSNPHHATIVTSAILSVSNEVRFYIKNLDGSVADNILVALDDKEPRFIQMLKSFLGEGKSIKIVVEDTETNASSQFYQYLKKEQKRIEVKTASDLFTKNIQEGFKLKMSNSDFFFMVGDRKSFRINYDREKGEAICNFNRPEIGERLFTNFDKYYDSCQKYIFID